MKLYTYFRSSAAYRYQQRRALIAVSELRADASQRADQHQPFGAQRQDASALGKDQPQRRQGKRYGEVRRVAEPVGDHVHQLSPP